MNKQTRRESKLHKKSMRDEKVAKEIAMKLTGHVQCPKCNKYVKPEELETVFGSYQAYCQTCRIMIITETADAISPSPEEYKKRIQGKFDDL